MHRPCFKRHGTFGARRVDTAKARLVNALIDHENQQALQSFLFNASHTNLIRHCKVSKPGQPLDYLPIKCTAKISWPVCSTCRACCFLNISPAKVYCYSIYPSIEGTQNHCKTFTAQHTLEASPFPFDSYEDWMVCPMECGSCSSTNGSSLPNEMSSRTLRMRAGGSYHRSFSHIERLSTGHWCQFVQRLLLT